MASSKLVPSRNLDLKRKLSGCASGSSTRLIDFLRNSYVDTDTGSDSDPVTEGEGSSTLLNAEITLLDAAGAVTPISDCEVGNVEPPRAIRKTVDDVWREIVAGKKRQTEQVPKQEMMTLEDFLVKAGAVEGEASGAGAGVTVEVKEEMMSGGIYGHENSPVVGMATGLEIGVDVGDFGNGRGRGKRTMSLMEPLDKVAQQKPRSLSLLEPLDKATQQRQRRMIKNRESAARSRERKQAYQVELESMAVRLQEENEQLLKEKAEWTKERLKQLMENVIPVMEKRRPSRFLQRVRSVPW
ncbi:G-box-binding factor 4-like isoform X2 [Olea europaea var. sylvestris]|uniref:G-box-binding factor 4-like isoform X2 n=1 Tax=Olea europaea var. sylvestris TaxID=158386 RepID=UPI000C1D7D02|nr:G-box-binding factor 4-like isoform X2 [Olea europaea var. sylvestris]